MTIAKTLGLVFGVGFMLGLPAVAAAQAADTNPDSAVTITPRQGKNPDEAAPRPLFGPGSDGKIHGEVGAGIGTNGYREAYGTVAIPLGDHAGAVISFDSYRINAPRRWYHW